MCYRMKSFEEFKVSREKMDPSTRNMSEHQWSQAYAAYCSSRELARSGRSSSGRGSSRRRSSTVGSVKGAHAPSTLSASAVLKAQVRAESAYADLRLMVNVLSWVLLAVIVIVAILQGIVLGSIVGGGMDQVSGSLAGAGVALLSGTLQAVGVILLRLIVHVIIDIPDVALYRACEAQTSVAEAPAE